MKKICANPKCENEVTGKGKYCSYKCSLPAMKNAIEQLKKKEGPIYEKWKARLAASIEGIPGR